jgi:hypothetical protein
VSRLLTISLIAMSGNRSGDITRNNAWRPEYTLLWKHVEVFTRKDQRLEIQLHVENAKGHKYDLIHHQLNGCFTNPYCVQADWPNRTSFMCTT